MARNVLNTAREESTHRDKILSCSALNDGHHCCKPAWCDLVVEWPHPEASSNHFNTRAQKQHFECSRKEIINCKQLQQYRLLLLSLVQYVTWKDSNSFYYCNLFKKIAIAVQKVLISIFFFFMWIFWKQAQTDTVNLAKAMQLGQMVQREKFRLIHNACITINWTSGSSRIAHYHHTVATIQVDCFPCLQSTTWHKASLEI